MRLHLYFSCITTLMFLITANLLIIESLVKTVAANRSFSLMGKTLNSEGGGADKKKKPPIVQTLYPPVKAGGSVSIAKNEALNIEPKLSIGLHLASYRNIDNANEGWNELLQANSEILTPLTMVTKRINLGVNEGIYYRVIAVGLSDMKTAVLICSQLRESGQYCEPMTVIILA